MKVEKLCEKYWINFVYKEEYWWYYDIDREQISKDKKWTMKKVHEFNKELEEDMNNCNCTYEEVQTFSVYKSNWKIWLKVIKNGKQYQITLMILD